jgi:hypothetical protein
MSDVAPTALPPQADHAHGGKQHLGDRLVNPEPHVGLLEDGADAGGVQIMRGSEESVDERPILPTSRRRPGAHDGCCVGGSATACDLVPHQA